MSSIKVPDTITKLSPGDDYPVVEGTDVGGFDDLKGRMDVAEGHLQTLQQSDVSIGQDISQLQSQVFTGMKLEDDSGNSFNDITGIAFDGAEVQDDQGTGLATVRISPKVSIANGQAPDSTSANGNAIIFPGATITPDPSDSNVVTVSIPSSGDGGGIVLGDGVNASREVKTVILRGHQAYGTDHTAEIHLEFAHFKTISERDAWSAKFGSGMTYDTVAVVDKDDDNFVAWYKFNSETKSWEEYYAQGIVMSDSDGAIPKNIKTVVFGPGFAIQQAGDQEDAALVTYAGHADGQILSVGQSFGDYHSVSKVSDIETRYPIEVSTGKKNPTDPEEGTAILTIKPDAYEPMQAPSFLANTSDIRPVRTGQDTVVFCDNPITPYGMYFSVDNQLEGLQVQEDDERDPNLGGQLTELLGSVEFETKAPSKGNIKLWFMYHQNGAFIPTGYVTGSDGNPIIVEKSFNTGDDLKMIVSGAYYAKGQETITLHVEHSFSGEDLTMVPELTMLCVNQFDRGAGSSVARIEFMRRLGVQITPVIYKFDSPFIRLSDSLYGRNEPESSVGTGEGEEYIAQFGINNLAPCNASITNGVLSIGDNGSDILDFYMDYLVDNTRTSMMRGHEFKADIRIGNVDSAYNLALFKWTGRSDQVSKIYSGRTDGSINLNSGWEKVDETFIAENPDGGASNHSLTVTIPDDAGNLAFAIYPVSAQQPMNLTVEEFSINPATPFTGYVEIDSYNLHEVHLRESDDFIEYGQNSEGYASLRYTINYNPISGLPCPIGGVIKGNAPFTLDPAKNVISGSDAKGGEGALKASKDGQVSLSCDYLLWNEQNADTVVRFWWMLETVDGVASKIANSEIEFTVPKQTTTHGILKTQPSFVFEVESGQWVYPRMSANKADGAFLQSTKLTDYMVRPVIDFKELSADASDSNDLVSAPMQKAMIVDRRIHSFSGNAQQNIQISNLDIPFDVELAHIDVVKKSGTVTTSINSAEYSYDSSTQVLTVHVGSGASEGKVYLSFWGAIA